MPVSRRYLILGIVPLLTAGLAPTAAADVSMGPRIRRAPRPSRQPQLRFEGVHVTRRNAPDVDVELVHQQATLAISRQRSRISRCIRSADLRRDPNRRGARELAVTLTFNRRGQPTVGQPRGNFPGVARQCVIEALRGIAVRAVPQGTVAVEARFSLR